MQTNLTINSKYNDKKITDKILHVNPNITDENALLLAHAINNLTNNTYDSTTKTTSIDLDTEAKPVRPLDVYYITNTGAMAQIPADHKVTFTQLGTAFTTNKNLLIRFDLAYDGVIPIISNLNFNGEATVTLGNLTYGFTSYLANRCQFPISFTDAVAGTLSFDIGIIATEQYSAVSQHVEIILVDDSQGE